MVLPNSNKISVCRKALTGPARVVMAAFAIAALVAGSADPASAAKKKKQEAPTFERIVAIINDEPISEYDISQRSKLMAAMGAFNPKTINTPEVRKRVLDMLVDEHLQRQEARRLKVAASSKDVSKQLTTMANSGGGLAHLTKLLSSKGVQLETLKKQIEARLIWSRIVRGRYGALFKITQDEIDRRYQQALANPAPPKISYVLRPIVLNIQRGSSQGLVQARLAEAQIIVSRFRGCNRIRAATKGIFDVTIGAARELPKEKMPAKLRAALDKAGPGKLLPAGMRPRGFELIAFCGRKKIAAPAPSRDDIENKLFSEQLGMMSQRYLRDLRRDAVIEYR